MHLKKSSKQRSSPVCDGDQKSLSLTPSSYTLADFITFGPCYLTGCDIYLSYQSVICCRISPGSYRSKHFICLELTAKSPAQEEAVTSSFRPELDVFMFTCFYNHQKWKVDPRRREPWTEPEGGLNICSDKLDLKWVYVVLLLKWSFLSSSKAL